MKTGTTSDRNGEINGIKNSDSSRNVTNNSKFNFNNNFKLPKLEVEQPSQMKLFLLAKIIEKK